MIDMTLEGIVEQIRRRRWFEDARSDPSGLAPADRASLNLGLTLPHPQRAIVRTRLDEVTAQNSTSPARRRLLGIDGDFATGKSSLLTEIAVDLCQEAWGSAGAPDETAPDLSMPVFYANVSASGERDLMIQVARSMRLGALVPSQPTQGTARILLGRVGDQCRRSGTLHGFLDDANMTSTSGRGTHMTQFFKTMLNDIPATLVVIGKGLRDTPLFRARSIEKADADAAMQLTRRLTLVTLEALPKGRGFGEVLRESAGMFLLNGPERLSGFDAEDLAWLYGACGGRPGSLFEILTTAAARAVGQEECLTPQLLRDVHAVLGSGSEPQ